MTQHELREDVAAVARNTVAAFVRHFGRAPNEREADMLTNAIIRYFAAPDAPTHRLQ
ncbi:hypothetical protein R1538_18405 [Rhizobium leguminosarum]|uniref:hypothetical protein n=1 Tax=Rhizobium leguminosarum TaxID=384 RepID=UPI00293DDD31|nr:hypothetical protein [Rhizobium leguminosarum]MDV4163097.1 hypothetical protein [Rhizobium leguminosarum]MDV4172614.1 hypothetical protein [Rhizobium leguminosarum]